MYECICKHAILGGTQGDALSISEANYHRQTGCLKICVMEECQNTKEMSTYPHPDLVYKIHVYVMATANSDPEFLTSHNTSIAFEVYLINT